MLSQYSWGQFFVFVLGLLVAKDSGVKSVRLNDELLLTIGISTTGGGVTRIV